MFFPEDERIRSIRNVGDDPPDIRRHIFTLKMKVSGPSVTSRTILLDIWRDVYTLKMKASGPSETSGTIYQTCGLTFFTLKMKASGLSETVEFIYRTSWRDISSTLIMEGYSLAYVATSYQLLTLFTAIATSNRRTVRECILLDILKKTKQPKPMSEQPITGQKL
jgi:hypothetical protein